MLEQNAIRLLKFLKSRAEKDAPHIHTQGIIEEAQKVKVKLTEPEIRKHVNALRDMKEPICSDNTGYWYALKSDELESTIHQIDGRIKELAEVSRKLRELKRDMEKRETDIFSKDPPIIRAIKQEFEAELITSREES